MASFANRKVSGRVAAPSRSSAATHRERLTHMRVQVHRMMPYLSGLVYGMKPCPRPGIKTMCVDVHGRCYYDPEFVETLSDTEGAYVLIHEVCHLVLRHCHRFQKMLPHPSETERETFNIAADLVVEQTMCSLRRFAPKGGVTYAEYAAKIPDLKPGLTVEEYYGLLMKDRPGGGGGGDGPKQEPTEGNEDGPSQPRHWPDHSEAPGPLNPKNSGSSSDNQPRDYEEQGDTGMDDIRVDSQLRDTEQAMNEYESKGRGNVPGNLKKAIADKLRPQPDPWQQLKSACARAVSSTVGSPESTYRKRNRRQQDTDDFLLKGVEHLMPKAVLVLDNSGSMCGLEGMCSTVIQQGLKRLKELQVVAGDTEEQYAGKITNLSQYEWTGGGGTDMGAIVEKVDAERKPDAIILVTDGYTPWPDTPTRARLIIALCADTDTPRWAKTIPVFKTKENA